MKHIIIAVFLTAIMIGSVLAETNATTTNIDTTATDDISTNTRTNTETHTEINTSRIKDAVGVCTTVTKTLCTTRTIERCTNETGEVRCVTDSKPYCLNKTETRCTGENVREHITEEVKYRFLNHTGKDITNDDADDLLEEVEIDHPENFTKRINQGRLISEIEQVKRKYFQALIHELRATNSTVKISFYATRFNEAMNALKDDIREKIRNNETLTRDVVEELANRQLLNITDELRANVVFNEDRLVSLILNKSSGNLTEGQIREKLNNMSSEFKRKLLKRMLSERFEDHKEITDQIRGINEQYKTRIKALREQIKDLNKERIDKIRELLKNNRNATAVIEAENETST